MPIKALRDGSANDRAKAAAICTLWPFPIIGGCLAITLALGLLPLLCCVGCGVYRANRSVDRSKAIGRTLAVFAASPLLLLFAGLFLVLSPLNVLYAVCKAPNGLCPRRVLPPTSLAEPGVPETMRP